MGKDICKALEYLPEEFITEEIVNSAIEAGDIKLLDHIPHVFMTTENINKLILKESKSWNSFSLNSIPAEHRSLEVCEAAVKSSSSNFMLVPDELKNETMFDEWLVSLHKKLHLLPQIPQRLWNTKNILNAVRSLATSGSSYGRNRYASSSTTIDLQDLQILIAHLPKKLINGKFYISLFGISYLSSENLEFIIPNRNKQGKYYELLANKDFDKVPTDMFTYNVLWIALHKTGYSSLTSSWNSKDKDRDQIVSSKIIELMDDRMADMIVAKSPTDFRHLPSKFRTESRLQQILQTKDNECRWNNVIGEDDNALLTAATCKLFIAKGGSYPDIPEHIWTQEFVDFCFGHNKSFSWFKQMPKEFQTQDMVNEVIDSCYTKIQYVRQELITEEMAKEVFRADMLTTYKESSKYIPNRYFSEFTDLTGLPKEFFGGEVSSYYRFREDKQNYTYCKLGHVCIGYYLEGDRYDPEKRIIMTRRTPMAVRPGVVFSRRIATFHVTWLEKLIADYDSQTEKPTLKPGTKKYQDNIYFGVRESEVIRGHKIYVNTFVGANIYYAVELSGEVHFRSSLESIKEIINEHLEEQKNKTKELQTA